MFTSPHVSNLFFSFLHDTPTPDIYTLSLHDALPICAPLSSPKITTPPAVLSTPPHELTVPVCGSVHAALPVVIDRKSTRLNSSHLGISYAVFCLKKKRNLS